MINVGLAQARPYNNNYHAIDSHDRLLQVFTITHKCACPGVCGDTGGGDISGPIGLSLIIL